MNDQSELKWSKTTFTSALGFFFVFLNWSEANVAVRPLPVSPVSSAYLFFIIFLCPSFEFWQYVNWERRNFFTSTGMNRSFDAGHPVLPLAFWRDGSSGCSPRETERLQWVTDENTLRCRYASSEAFGHKHAGQCRSSLPTKSQPTSVKFRCVCVCVRVSNNHHNNNKKEPCITRQTYKQVSAIKTNPRSNSAIGQICHSKKDNVGPLLGAVFSSE